MQSIQDIKTCLTMSLEVGFTKVTEDLISGIYLFLYFITQFISNQPTAAP